MSSLSSPESSLKIDLPSARARLASRGWKNIDEVTEDQLLAGMLGVPRGQRQLAAPLAKALVAHDLLPAIRPTKTGHGVTKSGNKWPSYFLNPEIVGEDAVITNFKLAVAEALENNGWKTIDDITIDSTIATALGLQGAEVRQAPALAKALVDKNLISADWPSNTSHAITTFGGRSLFVRPEVVGEVKAKENLKLAAAEFVKAKGWNNIDDVMQHRSFSAAIGLADNNLSTLAKALIELEIFPSSWPTGTNHKLFRGSSKSRFLDPATVGAAIAESNINIAVSEYLRSKGWSNLDDVKLDKSLATLLGATNVETITPLLKALINRNFLSSAWPANTEHKFFLGSAKSRFFDPEAVGVEVAKSNLDLAIPEYLRSNGWSYIEDVTPDQPFAALIGASEVNRTSSLVKALVDKGFLSAVWPANTNHSISVEEGSRTANYFFIPEAIGIERVQTNLQLAVTEFIRANGWKTIDQVTANRPLAVLLEVEEDKQRQASALAKALFSKGFLTGNWPVGANHPITKSRMCRSHFLDPEVVGDELALKNLKVAVPEFIAAQGWKTIDDVTYNPQLVCALAIESGKLYQMPSLVKALLDHGFFSSEWPAGIGHPIATTGRGSSYFLAAEIVGKERAEKNLKLAVSEVITAQGWKSIDDVLGLKSLAVLLGVEEGKKEQAMPLAKALVDRAFFPKEWPANSNHPILKPGKGPSYFVNKEVVGEDQARKNLRLALLEHIANNGWITIDDISPNPSLAAAIGIEESKQQQTIHLIKTLIERGFFSARIPDLYWPVKRTRYLNESFVGTDCAISNARILMLQRYTDVSQIQITNPVIFQILNLFGYSQSGAKKELEFLHEKVWGQKFRSNFDTIATARTMGDRPPVSVSSSNTKEKKFLESGIGAFIERRSNEPLSFIKGQLFEQLGAFLLFAQNPKLSLMPKYCLDVSSTFVGNRVDFLQGSALYEFAWSDPGHEMDTRIKRRLTAGLKDRTLLIITMEPSTREQVQGVGCVSFSDCLLQIQPEAATRIQALSNRVRALVADRKVQELRGMRDYLYNQVDYLNQLHPENRFVALVGSLDQALVLTDEQYVTVPFQADAYPYNALEATYYIDGKAYRTIVSFQELAADCRELRLKYFFNTGPERCLTFTDVVSRDLAVFLECVTGVIDDNGSIEAKTFLASDLITEEVAKSERPIFTVPIKEGLVKKFSAIPGNAPSSENDVIDLSDDFRNLHEHFNFKDQGTGADLFEFAKKWIVYYGANA